MRSSLVLAFLLLTISAAAAAPLTIRVAWTAVPADLTPVLLDKKDLLDHLGKSYTVEPVHFGEAATAVRALAAGEIDVAALPPPAFAIAVRNAGLDDLRIIADGYQDGVPRRYASEFLVRDDSAIATIDDLAGKVLAVDALGGMSDLALRAELRRYALDAPRRARIVAAPLPSLGAMLEAGKIDLAALGAPFSYMLKARGNARPLFTLRDALGPTEGLMLVARAGFLGRNRAAVIDFLEDDLRALRWFVAPVHRDEAVLIVAAFSRAPRALYDDYLFSDDDYYRDRAGRPDLAALQTTMNALRDLGFLDIALDVRHYADLSFIDEAAQRLD
jgi:sulfonate transport system substrate-binding protein